MLDIDHIVTEVEAKTRIDKLLVDLCPTLSRSRIKQLIDYGYVLVNDEETKSAYRVKIDDSLTAEWPPVEDLEVLPEPMELDILYEDGDLLVVNKARGLVVHPGAGNPNHTLVNGLLAHCTDLSGINGVLRPGIVHRIDKDTSGCLVVAKNDIAHHALSDQLHSKTLKRTYLALVHGIIQHNSGIIDAPIGRDKYDRQKMTVTAVNSRAAITHFTVLERFKDASLVECRLDTGRTHQIRVHFNYINYPIVGDPKYAKSTIDTQGQCLHAYKIEFIHPRTKETLRFTAEMPPYLSNLLEQLRQGHSVKDIVYAEKN
jgi:23S rRNA pseudouridine1911/1915/1917 synthase